jgi:hypothetical protein
MPSKWKSRRWVEISDGSCSAHVTTKRSRRECMRTVNHRLRESHLFTASAVLRETPAAAGCAFWSIGAGASLIALLQ